MWEEEVHIYNIPGVHNNFSIDSHHQKKKKIDEYMAAFIYCNPQFETINPIPAFYFYFLFLYIFIPISFKYINFITFFYNSKVSRILWLIYN